MIQKLLEQLKQEREYPGSYSKEGWLALDSRLEEFDRRRRRRRALVWWLPFMLLLGLNGWLWQSLYRAHKQQLADINRKVTVIVDTIYQKHTVVITDTVFLSKPYSSPFTDGGLFLHPSGLDRQRRHQIAGNYKESIQDSLAASVLSQRTQTNNGEELAANKPHDLTFIEPLAGRLPARVFSRPQTKKNLDDTSDSDITYVSARRSPVNKEL